MESTKTDIEPKFLPSLVQGYVIGTLSAAFALHIAISILAPGDGGTMIALFSWPILIVIVVALAIIGVVAFPAAVILGWPFRNLAADHPIVAFFLAIGVGTAVGGLVTATMIQVGPKDNFSGPVVGFCYGLTWFLVLRTRILASKFD